MESVTELIKLLGEDNAEQLKKNIVNIITERVRDDLEHYNNYLLCPSNMESVVNDTYFECMEEIKPKLKKKLYSETLKKFESLNGV